MIIIYKDGSVERLLGSPYVLPSPNQNPHILVSLPKISPCQTTPISPLAFTSQTSLKTKPKSFSFLRWVASHTSNKDTDGNKEQWLVRFGDFDRLYIGGDSAGGNITHNMAMKAGVESLCGGVGVPSQLGLESRGEDFEKTLPYLVWDLVYPSAPEGIENPMLNPAGEGEQRLAGLACSRLLVCVAGKEELRDRGVWCYDLVKESGWKGEVELFEVEGEDHCYHILCESVIENVKKMIKRLASFLV